MDKIILATTLAALMAANTLPALSDQAEAGTRADKSNAARDHVSSNKPATRGLER